MRTVEGLTPEAWFHSRATDYVLTQIIFHLNQVGVFRAIAKKKATAKQLGAELKLDAKILTFLLEYVYHTDFLLTRDSDLQFGLSDFGQKVCERYSRQSGGETYYNFFDVRVGGYQAIWSSLTDVLRGDKKLGQDVKRDGRYSESALRVLGRNLFKPLNEIIHEFKFDSVTEFGVGSCILTNVAVSFPQVHVQGVDFSAEVIKLVDSYDKTSNARITWIESDLWDFAKWQPLIQGNRYLFYTIHAHEFLKYGRDRMAALIKSTKDRFPNSYFMIVEEARPLDEQQQDMAIGDWLYSHANILIHELAEKGTILPEKDWIELVASGGYRLVKKVRTGFLAFEAYLFGPA